MHGRALATVGSWPSITTAWHALALRPHTLVRNSTGVFLIIAQGRFAARAWLATALGDSEAGPRTWAFDLCSPWVWLFISNIEEWFTIDFTWTRIPCPSEAGRFGYVVAAERLSASGARDVPAVVDAFLDRGHHRLNRADRKQFCEQLGSMPGAPRIKYSEAAEASLFSKLMHQHPRLEEMLGKLSAWWKAEAKRTARRPKHGNDGQSGSELAETSSSDDDPAIEHCALTVAALEGLDEQNAQEWKKKKNEFGVSLGLKPWSVCVASV